MQGAFEMFLSGYLHQDSDVEYRDVFEAAARFVTSESSALVSGVLDEVRQLLSTELTDSELQLLLESAGSYFRPKGSTRAWLQDIHDVMAESRRNAPPW